MLEAVTHAIAPLVYVVDDEPLALEGLRRLLEAAGVGVRVFDTPEAFLRAVNPGMAGCLLLDVRMPGLDGLELQQRIRAAGCHLPIIFLTGYGDIPTSVRTMKAGAMDFLLKPVEEKDLFNALDQALRRDESEREERRESALIEERARRLTPSENKVFALVITGMLNKQIAGVIGTAEKTVKVHRGRVMKKMGAQSIADLIRMAERLGMQSHPLA